MHEKLFGKALQINLYFGQKAKISLNCYKKTTLTI